MDVKRNEVWAFIAAIGIVVVCFANSIPNDFVLDDYQIVAVNPAIRTIAPVRLLTSSYWGTNDAGIYRPLTILTFSFEYPFWKRWAGGYRLVNLFLHAINGFLVFLLARRLFKDPSPAWVTSAIYLAHPSHTEAVVALIGRAELLAAMFFLIAWLLFRGGRPLLCGVAFLFSLLSKENAIVFPAVIVLDSWISEGNFRSVATRWQRFVPTAVAAGVYLGLRLWVLGGLAMERTAQYLGGSWTLLQRELTSGRAFLKYFQLLIAPIEVSGDYDFNSIPLADMSDVTAWLGVLVILSTIAVALAIVKRRPILAFAILFFYLTILPVSNWIVPTSVIMAERHLYLPSLGICLIAGLVWTTITKVELRRLLTVGVMAVAALLCIAHNYIWRDNLSFYGNVVRVFPNNVRGRQGYGVALLEAGRAADARAQFEAGLQIRRDAPLLVGMAETLMQLERGCATSRPVLAEALALQPYDPFAQWLLGKCFEREGRTGKAEQSYGAAVRNTAFPDPRLLFDWGVALEQLGKPSAALEAYRRAVLLNPADSVIQNRLTQLLSVQNAH